MLGSDASLCSHSPAQHPTCTLCTTQSFHFCCQMLASCRWTFELCCTDLSLKGPGCFVRRCGQHSAMADNTCLLSAPKEKYVGLELCALHEHLCGLALFFRLACLLFHGSFPVAPQLLNPQPPPLLVEVYFVAWINYHFLDRSIIQPPSVPQAAAAVGLPVQFKSCPAPRAGEHQACELCKGHKII